MVFGGRGEAHGVSCSLGRAPHPVPSPARRRPVAQGASASPLHPHQKTKKIRESHSPPHHSAEDKAARPQPSPSSRGRGHGGEPCSPWGSQKLGFQHGRGQLRLLAGAQPPRQPRKAPLAPAKPGSTIQRAISQWQKKGTCQGEAVGHCRRRPGRRGGPGQPRCSPPGSPAAGPGAQHSATSASSRRNLAPKSPAASPPAFLPPGGSPSGWGNPSRSPCTSLLRTSGSLLAQGARPDPSPTQLLLPTPPKPPNKNKAGEKKKVIAVSSSPRSPVPPASFGLQPHHQRGGTLQLSAQPELRSHPPKKYIL